jgi:hypothetical protein
MAVFAFAKRAQCERMCDQMGLHTNRDDSLYIISVTLLQQDISPKIEEIQGRTSTRHFVPVVYDSVESLRARTPLTTTTVRSWTSRSYAMCKEVTGVLVRACLSALKLRR